MALSFILDLSTLILRALWMGIPMAKIATFKQEILDAVQTIYAPLLADLGLSFLWRREKISENLSNFLLG